MKNLDIKKISKSDKEYFTIENNTFIKEKILNEGIKIEYEIGDIKQKDFIPQFKTKHWDNECNFSIRYVEKSSKESFYEEKDGVVKLINDTYEVHFFEKIIDWREEFKKDKVEIDYNQPIIIENSPFEHLKCGDFIIARDTPEERSIRQEVAEQASGNILIVGLGLGVINEYLNKAKSVTIVEINKDVIDVVSNKYPKRIKDIKIINQDFYEYVNNTTDKFDFIYGDIFPRLGSGDILEWIKFVNEAQKVINDNGIIDGRAKQVYESDILQSKTEEAFEFEIVLKEKPTINIFNFSIQTKNFEFLYQPELTEEEKKYGCFRPDSVVGSYAVYHKYNKDNKYGTGKAFHIYRPKIIDANGNFVWGKLSIDEEKGILSIHVPQDFLELGIYPIIVDPTFGYTTSGSSSEGGGGNIIYVLPATSGSDATNAEVTKISVITASASNPHNSKANIYNNDNTQLTNGQTPQNSSHISGTNDYTYSTKPVIAASTTYKLCAWGASGKLAYQVRYDTGSSGDGATQSLTYGSWPSTLSATNNNRRYSIYATYEIEVPTETKTHTINALKLSRTTTTNTIDSLLRKAQTSEHTIGSLLITRNTNTHTLNSFIEKPDQMDNKIFQDGDNFIFQDSINYIFNEIAVPQYFIDHTIDSLLRKAQTSSITVDSLLYERNTDSHTFDSLLKKVNTSAHSLDSIFKIRQSNSHSIDSLLSEKQAETSTHTIDSLLVETATSIHTIDSLLRQVQSSNNTIDTLIKETILDTHNIDTFLNKQDTDVHTIDSFKLIKTTNTHTISSFIAQQGVQTSSHTIDTIKKSAETSTHSISSYLVGEGRLHYWNGSSWIKKKFKSYNGTFTQRELKIWDGSNWIL